MTQLEGRIAIVTGAARGIGRAIARGLAEAGAAVIVTDVHEDEAAEAAKAIGKDGARARAFRLDVSDPVACDALAAKVGQEIGAVSILVNNAGVIFPGRIDAEGVDALWD